MDSKPEPPPAAVLVRLVRKAAGLSASEAARRVSASMPKGISTARWSQIENGYEIRAGGHIHPVEAEAGMLAHMAGVVGISPERLASEGHRPDAAEVLREISRQQEDARVVPLPLRPRRRLPRATPELAAAMADNVAAMEARIEAARAAHPGERLTGELVFMTVPRMPAAAWYFDQMTADGWEAAKIPAGIAAMLTLDEEAIREEGGHATMPSPTRT